METLKVTKTLARKVETTAKQMCVSSEKLVSLALEDFIKRNQIKIYCNESITHTKIYQAKKKNLN